MVPIFPDWLGDIDWVSAFTSQLVCCNSELLELLSAVNLLVKLFVTDCGLKHPRIGEWNMWCKKSIVAESRLITWILNFFSVLSHIIEIVDCAMWLEWDKGEFNNLKKGKIWWLFSLPWKLSHMLKVNERLGEFWNFWIEWIDILKNRLVWRDNRCVLRDNLFKGKIVNKDN